MVISFDNVSKTFGKKKILDGVSLSFPDKGLSVVVGPGEAGKTTLLRIISGELRPDHGSVAAVKGTSFAVAGEECAFLPHLSIPEYCSVWSLLYPAFNEEKFVSLISEADISSTDRISRLPKEKMKWFSNALVFASGAEVMILDEPLQHFDQIMKGKTLAELKKEAEEWKNIIIGTSEIAEFEDIADFIAILGGGRVICSAEAGDLRSSHRLIPGATTLSPDYDTVGPVFSERLVRTNENIGREASLKEIVLGYLNGNCLEN